MALQTLQTMGPGTSVDFSIEASNLAFKVLVPRVADVVEVASGAQVGDLNTLLKEMLVQLGLRMLS